MARFVGYAGGMAYGAVTSAARIVTAPARYAMASSISELPKSAHLPCRLCSLVYDPENKYPEFLDADGKRCDKDQAIWKLDRSPVRGRDQDNMLLQDTVLVYHNGIDTHATVVHVAIRGTDSIRDTIQDLHIAFRTIGSKWGYGKDLGDFAATICGIEDVINRYKITKPDSSGHQPVQLYVHGHSLGGTKAVVAAGYMPEITSGCVFNPGANDVTMVGVVATAGVAATYAAFSAAALATAQTASTAFVNLTAVGAEMAAADAVVAGCGYGAAAVTGVALAQMAYDQFGADGVAPPQRMHAYHIFGDPASCSYPWASSSEYTYAGETKTSPGMITYTLASLNPNPLMRHSMSTFMCNLEE